MVLEQFIVSLNTEFLSKVLFLLLATISITGYISLNKIFFFSNKLSHDFLIIRSSIFFSYAFIIFSLINFFIPINDKLVFFFYLLGIFIFFIKYLNNELKIEIKLLFALSLFIILYLLNSGVNNDFDYHSHHIELYKNFSFFDFNQNIFDGRIKYNSGYLLLNSITYLTISDISVKFLSAYLFSVFILDIRKYISLPNNNFLISKILPIFFLICIYLTLSKFKNIGTDYIAHIVYLSLIIFYLFMYSANKEFFFNRNFSIILFIILAFLIVLKISMILCSLVCIHYFYLLYEKKKLNNIFSIFLVFPITLLAIWIFQNISLSQCLIYPIEKLCFIDDKTHIIFESNMISLFAKSVKINYWNENILSLKEMNNISFWIMSWFNDHFFKILEKFIPALIIFNLITFRHLSKKEISNQNIPIKHETLLISIWVFTLIVWFLQAPAMRFGFSYLVITFFLINFYFLRLLNFSYQKIISSNYFNKVFNFLFMLMICYQLYRINF